MLVLELTYRYLVWALMFVQLVIGLGGIVGAIQVLTTRDDAFTAADRQSKWVWAAMLFAGGIAAAGGFNYLSLLAIIGMVVIGIYWFDVRPQIKDILAGNYGW